MAADITGKHLECLPVLKIPNDGHFRLFKGFFPGAFNLKLGGFCCSLIGSVLIREQQE